VILGGGPSGLGVAWELALHGHTNITVVEKGSRLGGLSGSFDWEGSILDYGPHRFSPEYPELVARLRNLLGEDLLEVSNDHSVVFRDRFYSYPPRVPDFLNASSVKFSAQVLSSFALGKAKSAFRKKRSSRFSFREHIVDSFGERLYEDVVDPLCRKVWGDPAEIDPSFARIRFSVPTFVQWGKRWLGESSASQDKVFYYPRKGFQQLWDRLAEDLKKKGVEIFLDSQPERLDVSKGKICSVQIATKDGKVERHCNWVMSSIPTPSLLSLLSGAQLKTPPSGPLPYRGMILVVLLVKRETTLPARVVIFPEAKFSFNRLSEQNQFSRETVPEGYSAIQADIVAEVGSALWNEDDSVIEAMITQQIVSLGLFTQQEIAKSLVVRVPMAYPLPTEKREQSQREWNEKLSTFSNLICSGRFSSSDYNNSHSALQKGRILAQFILEGRSSSEWYAQAENLRQIPIRD
jgi:protoporphyrinogen oxidase